MKMTKKVGIGVLGLLMFSKKVRRPWRSWKSKVGKMETKFGLKKEKRKNQENKGFLLFLYVLWKNDAFSKFFLFFSYFSENIRKMGYIRKKRENKMILIFQWKM